MAATSIASQLQALRAAVHVSNEPEQGRKRPSTRPSILFDAKEAADIDLDTIFSIALSGLEDLISMEERFKNYKNDLFSQQSKELDRELVGLEENKRIDTSISAYLRLLSGYLELKSALRTLEYLIRRYKVHVFNKDNLIMCALPYHDTHVFVQIVRLIDTGNSRWTFLNGVKESGARMPRDTIVQQCIRDLGVLEAICDYATPFKKTQPSKHVIGFCTAVIFEVLGVLTITSNMVKIILPYVCSGLRTGSGRLNQKAGAMMIVSLLAQKAALSSNVAKSLLHLVSDVARAGVKDGNDLQMLRMSIMTLISIVQLQHVDLIPKKTIDVLSEVSDFLGVLASINNDFIIDKFLAVLIDSLIEHSAFDDTHGRTLLSLIEMFPLKDYVQKIVFRLLAIRLKLTPEKINSASSESDHVKQNLTCLSQKYPNEFRMAFFSFMKDNKRKKVNSSYDALCKILDEHFNSSDEVIDPKLLFSLEHSKPEIRISAILSIDIDSIVRERNSGSKNIDGIQDALLRRLYDEELDVVLAVVSLDNLADLISSPLLVEPIHHVLLKCTEILMSGSSKKSSRHHNTALACVEKIVRNLKNKECFSMILASAIFPLLLVRPKTQMYNFKALELAKELSWPFYVNLVPPKHGEELEVCISSMNFENVSKLGEMFSSRWEEYMPWLIKCCKSHDLSKTLFFLVLFQSLKTMKKDADQFLSFMVSCLPILKSEWEMLETYGISAKQSIKKIMVGDCLEILEDFLEAEIKNLNYEILASLLMRLLKAFTEVKHDNESLDTKGIWLPTLRDMFLFFTKHSKDVLREHLDFLFTKCTVSLTSMLLNMVTEEGIDSATQIEALHSLSRIYSEGSDSQNFLSFPFFFIPLSSDIQNVREAAIGCIEELFALWPHTSWNGNSGAHFCFLGEALRLIIDHKKMIISDANVFASLLTSLLSSSSGSLLVQQDIEKRFDDSTKNEMLLFIVNHALGLPAYSKLTILSLIKGVGSKLMSIPVMRSMLGNLLESCCQPCMGHGKNLQKLSQNEINILCLLLEICCGSSSSHVHELEDFILKALLMTGTEGFTVVGPSLAVLRNLNNSVYAAMKIETKELIFGNLLVLLRSKNGDLQNSAKETLLQLNVDFSVFRRVIESILNKKSSTHGKKKRKSGKHTVSDRCYDATENNQITPTLLSSLLDVLLMKESIENRTLLIGPLFELLCLILTSDDWIPKETEKDAHVSFSILKTLLLVMESICASVGNDGLPKDITQNWDLLLVISCARTSTDAVIRNHIFSLITTLVKIMPDIVLSHILDILVVVGESTVKQWDNYSQQVLEGLMAAIIPFWLSRINNTGHLLQIFVSTLPQVAQHRRLSIVTHILRTLGEPESLGLLIFFLFQSMISRLSLNSGISSNQSLDGVSLYTKKQWEYEFAMQLCGSYSCSIWLPSLVLLLKKFGDHISNDENYMQMVVVILFIADKLQDPEISYTIDSEEDLSGIHCTIGELMEQIVCQQHLIDSAKKLVGVPTIIKSEMKIFTRGVIRILLKSLPIAMYLKVITNLLGNDKEDVRKKALQLFCENVKDLGGNKKLGNPGSISRSSSSLLHLSGTSLELIENLCLETLKIFNSPDDVSNASMKMAALSALEVLADKFPLQDSTFSLCLGSVCKRICSSESTISSHCLLATGALVNALDLKALPELTNIMQCLLKKSSDIYSIPSEFERQAILDSATSNSTYYVFSSILQTLMTITDKLAGFLNPYLADILRLVILHPLLFSHSEPKLKLKADALRELIIEKIPVRLLLPPLLSMYIDAVKIGEYSVSTLFFMLGKLVASMDRASIASYHAKVFDFCLIALDLRQQKNASIQNIDVVEQNIIGAFVALTMKLTETMFRPLFIKIVEWSTSAMDDSENAPCEANNRIISFYILVNKLAESHRSLFVPYFKLLLDGCIKGLTGTDDTNPAPIQKKRKKAKNSLDNALSPQIWHLRTLILMALHRCFLYDTSGTTKFLDSSNFNALLKPIVSQLTVHPPKNHPTNEVDDLLVSCIGQMAVTADSDLLWKPLNHEVLMQTRSEMLRPRVLGLRIVKYLVDNLRDGYMAFLPETIPFLSELLEDSELSVKSLARDILVEMETISGESLKEYL